MSKSAHTASLILAAIAAAALGACSSSRSLDESFTDIGAAGELKSVLVADRTHEYGDVDITLFEGRLLLTGTMLTEEGRAKLLANAWKANGVDQIIDEVIVAEKTSFGQGFEDTRIDQTLRAKLVTDDTVSSGRFKIAVSRGVVYLIGAARSANERDRAVELARTVAGVEKVVSHVALPSARG